MSDDVVVLSVTDRVLHDLHEEVHHLPVDEERPEERVQPRYEIAYAKFDDLPPVRCEYVSAHFAKFTVLVGERVHLETERARADDVGRELRRQFAALDRLVFRRQFLQVLVQVIAALEQYVKHFLQFSRSEDRREFVAQRPPPRRLEVDQMLGERLGPGERLQAAVGERREVLYEDVLYHVRVPEHEDGIAPHVYAEHRLSRIIVVRLLQVLAERQPAEEHVRQVAEERHRHRSGNAARPPEVVVRRQPVVHPEKQDGHTDHYLRQLHRRKKFVTWNEF